MTMVFPNRLGDDCRLLCCGVWSCVYSCLRMEHDSNAIELVQRWPGEMPAYTGIFWYGCCTVLVSVHHTLFLQRSLHCEY